MGGARLLLAQATLNWMATASASALNCMLMRMKDLTEGVDLEDERGEVKYGKS